jgi:cellulose synthase/poly-beta-1,6-N-acetylglucosamine synthase-like glycosyltransferase
VIASTIIAMQWFFLLYFVAINAGYILLNLLSIRSLKRYLEESVLDGLPQIYSGFEQPVSILVPAYNEEATIASSIRSLLQMHYPEFEIIVINDGSSDATLATLIREFALVEIPETNWTRIKVKPVHAIYRSPVHHNLRVIDKENGGKADALNAGINASRFPLFCAMDADSILERSSLQRIVQPFLEYPETIAAGGSVRLANGCKVSGGFLTEVGLPRNPLALLQIVEYLRAFLFGRLGWSPLNAVLIISGAFGLFKKSAVVDAGGYNTTTVGEDMELVLRLHRVFRLKSLRYRITFVPDSICWTEAPESLRVLKSQRTRWQRGLAESLSMNIGLLFHRKGGFPGWLAFPFMVIFEWFGPVVEFVGYTFMIAGFAFGIVSYQALVCFLVVALGFGLMLSVSALLLEEISLHIYPAPGDLAKLLMMVVVENLGYRQLITFWRLLGLMRWALGGRADWGTMTRSADWQK